MIDTLRVAIQLKNKINGFIKYQSRVQDIRSRLENKLHMLHTYLENDQSLSAVKWEAFPSNGFAYRLNIIFSDLTDLKSWSGKILEKAVVIGVDGSQINFDHHVSPRIAMVQSGYLVMIGRGLNKNGDTATAFSETIPKIYGPEDLWEIDDYASGISDQLSIDYWRWMQETKIAICLAEKCRGLTPSCNRCEYYGGCHIKDVPINISSDANVVLFLDGSLIASFVQRFKTLADNYLKRTRILLQRCKELNVPVVGVIAHSNAKEISEVLSKALFRSGNKIDKTVLPSDASLFNSKLNRFGDRTPIFQSKRDILNRYGGHAIGFFYLRTSQGVPMRIEMSISPTPKTENSDVIQTTWKIIAAQCGIGRGYPYILGRSHEQAVLRTEDREQFYKITQGILSKYGYTLIRSPKVLRKIRPLL
ncbi:MAG: DNA double-strand break repair nuclease NurA [Candidatus Ranarchaeia archaeon]